MSHSPLFDCRNKGTIVISFAKHVWLSLVLMPSLSLTRSFAFVFLQTMSHSPLFDRHRQQLCQVCLTFLCFIAKSLFDWKPYLSHLCLIAVTRGPSSADLSSMSDLPLFKDQACLYLTFVWFSKMSPSPLFDRRNKGTIVSSLSKHVSLLVRVLIHLLQLLRHLNPLKTKLPQILVQKYE